MDDGQWSYYEAHEEPGADTELATLRAENERLRKALEIIRDMDTGPDKLAQSVADYELSGKVAPT